MGYAFIIFVVMFASALVMATVVTYGIVKDSQKAPLKALNTYAGIKTNQAQTKITIANTCLAGNGAYVTANKNSGTGPYTLWLTATNNKSTVLNPNNSSIFFNLSYFTFSITNGVGSSVPFGNAWTPITNINISVPNVSTAPGIYIYNLNYPYRLMMAASNGITAIAPTAPTNFSGSTDKPNTSYFFSWSPSASSNGIAYYLIYDVKQGLGSCPVTNVSILPIPGNSTSSYLSSLGFTYTCPKNPCPNTNFFITAIDNLGNMGVQSATLSCNPPTSNGNPCSAGTV